MNRRKLIPALPVAALVIAGLTAPVASAHSAAAPQPQPAVTASTSSDTLAPGQQLRPDQSLTSANGIYVLTQQGDGNLVLHEGTYAMWSSGTAGYPGAVTTMQSDGDLVMTVAGKPIWASNTSGYPGAALSVYDDGNLVITQNGSLVWSRHMAVGRLLPGQFLRDNDQVVSPNRVYSLYQQTGGNLVLLKGTRVLWSAGTSLHYGAQTVMQDDGNLVTAWNGRALWASNTSGNTNAYVAVQDDGNVVIYRGSTPLWATNTAGD
ncbi:MAG: hypothetical protein HOV87_26125 [Catenulispora sp.]|nr:hypothetical protein [Catenulispora sp.]